MVDCCAMYAPSIDPWWPRSSGNSCSQPFKRTGSRNAPASNRKMARSFSSPYMLPSSMFLYTLTQCDSSANKFMCEMLHVARECSAPAPPSPGPPQHTRISFEEFCLFSTDLQIGYHSSSASSPPPSQSHRPPPIARQRSDSARHRNASAGSAITKSSAPCEVFLGGSCNPTSWRHDVAIPTLRSLGISFYNPQVTHWEEALVEREHQAKSSASVLFFVFDRRTRNVASMVEVAYMAAGARKIMLVLDTYPGPGHLIGGEPMSRREYEELCGGLNTVQDLVERRGIPVFSQLNHALQCTAKILREDLWPQQLGVADHVTPVRFPHLQLGDKYSKIQNAFAARGRGTLTLSEVQPVVRTVMGRELTHDELLTVIAAKKGVGAGSLSACSELPLKEVTVTLDDLCCIVAEFSNPRLEQRRLQHLLANSVMSPLQKALGWASPRRSPRHAPSDSPAKNSVPLTGNNHSTYSSDCPTLNGGVSGTFYDVYLGGAGPSSDGWRDRLAVPTLHKNGLTFCWPGMAQHSKRRGDEADSCTTPNIAAPTKCVNDASIRNSPTSIARQNSYVCSSNCDDRPSSGSTRGPLCSKRAHRSNDSSGLPSGPVPTAEPDSERLGRLYPSEAANIDRCRVLLFVITNNTRCVSAMTLASHYVGLGCNVVLCVQKIPDNSIVDDEELSKVAIKDYNRGRSYLTDQAIKDGVPVFTDIQEALACVVQKCTTGAR